jgi:hypothetical protein
MLYVFLEALAQTLGVCVLEEEGRKGVSQSVSPSSGIEFFVWRFEVSV